MSSNNGLFDKYHVYGADGDTCIELGDDIDNMNIGIVQESNLVKYTDEHFINKLNRDLALIRDSILQDAKINNINERDMQDKDRKTMGKNITNSPILMSTENSDTENDNDHDNDNEDENYFDEEYMERERSVRKDFKKLSFQQVKNSLDKYYENEDKFSSELDILTTYAKGQKHLFLKAADITRTKINCLMIPSLFCTAGISVSAPMLSWWKYNSIIISILNAVATFFISTVKYFKLESLCEMFSNLAIQYDKIESSLEMTGNKFYASNYSNLHNEKMESIITKMNDIEKKMNEIKDTNSVFIPPELRRVFPIICHINIFSFIKRIETYKKNMIIKFRDIKNELRYIQWKYPHFMENVDNIREKNRFDHLCLMKEKIKNELIHYRNAYGHIDEIIIKEIKHAESKSFFGVYFGVYFGKNTNLQRYDDKNPVITDYLNIIFAE